ncbi:MAG: hypothetical protein NZ837_03330 [Gammaproteobacteria bacterium]|nr:hypothetical protein [Gammaproteobacteria bacterium]
MAQSGSRRGVEQRGAGGGGVEVEPEQPLALGEPSADELLENKTRELVPCPTSQEPSTFNL